MDHSKDLAFIKRTIELSRRSLESGEFPAASVLVRDGDEISYGLSSTEHLSDKTAHSEVQAIRAAGRQARAPLTLYSSLEPCLMCVAAGAWAGVTRIVCGCSRDAVDPSYYESQSTLAKNVSLLSSPPEIHFIDSFQGELVTLFKAYQKLKAPG